MQPIAPAQCEPLWSAHVDRVELRRLQQVERMARVNHGATRRDGVKSADIAALAPRDTSVEDNDMALRVETRIGLLRSGEIHRLERSERFLVVRRKRS